MLKFVSCLQKEKKRLTSKMRRQLLMEDDGGLHERVAKHVLEARVIKPSEMVRADFYFFFA